MVDRQTQEISSPHTETPGHSGPFHTQIMGAGITSPDERNFAGLRIKWCMDMLGELSGKVLEIGCGAGRYIRALKTYNPEIAAYGGDIQYEALADAKSHRADISYAQFDACKFPFGKEIFDLVCGFDVIEHVRDVRTCISEIHRVLRPGGRFHGFIPCEGTPFTIYWVLRKIHLFGHLKEVHGGHIQNIHRKELLKMLQSEGFETVDLRYSFHLFGQIGDFFDFLEMEKWFPEALKVSRVWGKMKRTLTKIAYIESSLLRQIPGMGIHITCVKKPRGNANAN